MASPLTTVPQEHWLQSHVDRYTSARAQALSARPGNVAIGTNALADHVVRILASLPPTPVMGNLYSGPGRRRQGPPDAHLEPRTGPGVRLDQVERGGAP